MKLSRILKEDHREQHNYTLRELVALFDKAKVPEHHQAQVILEYCQERGITLQQLEKDEPFK